MHGKNYYRNGSGNIFTSAFFKNWFSFFLSEPEVELQMLL